MQRKYFTGVIFRRKIFSGMSQLSTNRDLPTLGCIYPPAPHTPSECYRDFIFSNN